MRSLDCLATNSNRNCIFLESGQELSVSVCYKKLLGDQGVHWFWVDQKNFHQSQVFQSSSGWIFNCIDEIGNMMTMTVLLMPMMMCYSPSTLSSRALVHLSPILFKPFLTTIPQVFPPKVTPPQPPSSSLQVWTKSTKPGFRNLCL